MTTMKRAVLQFDTHLHWQHGWIEDKATYRKHLEALLADKDSGFDRILNRAIYDPARELTRFVDACWREHQAGRKNEQLYEAERANREPKP